jgi:hypothetical protein
MVAQDAKHETPVNISRLTVDQQIDEWIFQLRNQNAIQSIAPGIWDIFWADAAPSADGSAMDTSTPHRTSPAMQLVKLGNAAVPKLIECIGDSKPTRSTIFHRDLYFSDQLLTVGTCAEIVLSRIAGQRFGDGQTNNLARQEAEAWWREVSTKGEEQYLIERVAKGGKVSVEAAKALAAKFPETAFDCIANAIDGSNDTGVQSELLDVIGQLPRTEKATAYFKHQLKNARDLKTRVMAARSIMDQDRDNAIMTMIQEFQQMTTTDLGGHWESEELALISFLSQSNSAIAIQEIRKAYDSRKPPIRTAIIQSFLSRGTKTVMDQQLSTEVEALLVQALSDTVQLVGYKSYEEDGVFQNPRNCELAAHALRKLMPADYKFEFSMPMEVLEKERLDAIKSWRVKNQLPKTSVDAKP